MKEVWLVVAVVTATYAAAFRTEVSGTASFFLWFGLPHVALSAYVLYALHKDGTLRTRLTPKFGDLSLGVVVGLLLLVVVMGFWLLR